MNVASEVPRVVFDPQSSEPSKPHGIITVDCSSPHEYDDGIAVTPLDAHQELYKVDVFAVDTSALYRDQSIVERVITATESRYGDAVPNGSNYEPMMDSPLIQNRHFKQGTTRGALVVSFTVGAVQPPTDVSVSFGRVEVLKNWTYNNFGSKCRYSDNYRPFGRAAALIIKHLEPTFEDEKDDRAAYHDLIHVAPTEAWRRGSNINQAFMVAANHLVGRLMRDEDRLAIYRAHSFADTGFAELLDTNMAYYTAQPLPHDGLGLDVYSRVTSPLRRAEDFMMHGLLRARADGRDLTARDQQLVKATIKRLNQRIAAEMFNGAPRLREQPFRVGRRLRIAS